MEAGQVILILLICFFAVMVITVINYIIADYFYEIACEKGFSERRFFWVPFLLGIVGYLMVTALPDRAISSEETKDN